MCAPAIGTVDAFMLGCGLICGALALQWPPKLETNLKRSITDAERMRYCTRKVRHLLPARLLNRAH